MVMRQTKPNQIPAGYQSEASIRYRLIYLLLLRWNEFETELEERDRVFPLKFTMGDDHPELKKVIEALNETFWESVEVHTCLQNFEYEYNLETHVQISLETSHLDDDQSFEVIFDMGRLYERALTLISTSTNMSFEDLYPQKLFDEFYLMDRKDIEDLQKLDEIRSTFQKEGAKGNSIKGRQSQSAVDEFFKKNFPVGLDGRPQSYVIRMLQQTLEKLSDASNEIQRITTDIEMPDGDLTASQLETLQSSRKVLNELKYLMPLTKKTGSGVLFACSESTLKKKISASKYK